MGSRIFMKTGCFLKAKLTFLQIRDDGNHKKTYRQNLYINYSV